MSQRKREKRNHRFPRRRLSKVSAKVPRSTFEGVARIGRKIHTCSCLRFVVGRVRIDGAFVCGIVIHEMPRLHVLVVSPRHNLCATKNALWRALFCFPSSFCICTSSPVISDAFMHSLTLAFNCRCIDFRLRRQWHTSSVSANVQCGKGSMRHSFRLDILLCPFCQDKRPALMTMMKGCL